MNYTRLPPASRRHMLHVGKRVLVVLAMLMVVSIVVISNYNSGEKGGRVVLSGKEKTEKSRTVMENARYFGIDSKNRPFSISAAAAEQVDPNIIHLQQVQGDMLLGESQWMAVTADEGIIRNQGNEIVLQKNVNMFYEGGYEFRSEAVLIRPEVGYASGNQPIEGQSPSGTLLADSFEVFDHGDRMIFRNNVRTTIFFN